MLSKAFSWLSQSFELFKQAGFTFVFQTLFIFLTIVVSYLMKISVLSVFLYIIQLLLSAGMFISFDNLKNSKKITFDNLFDGFSNNLSNLIMLSIIFLLFSLIVSYFLVQFVNINAIYSFKHIDTKSYTPIFIIMLVDVIVNFVLMLAIPFVAIQKLSVFNAIKESIIVCMKNLISLIFLLIVYFVLAILATFSIIGWLVLFPVLIGSIYIIFKEHLQCTK
jgi:hypothetical protein